MSDDRIPIIKPTPDPAAYEQRSVFVRYQAVLAVIASVVAIWAYLGPQIVGFRDQGRDTARGLSELKSEFVAYRASSEVDARRTNDQLTGLIAKVELLVNMGKPK